MNTNELDQVRDFLNGDADTHPAEAVRDHLEREGYLHLNIPLSFDTYEALCAELGVIELRSDIKIDLEEMAKQQATRKVKNRPSAYQADELAFHTDNPRMRYLTWYIHEQDHEDGSMLFFDTRDLDTYFTAEELATMGEIKLRFSNRLKNTDQETFLEKALVTPLENGYEVYYQPWLVRDEYPPEQQRLVKKFAEYIEYKKDTQLIRVPVKRGECVFIDNNRLLHGRDRLAENSKRHLERFFIRVPETA